MKSFERSKEYLPTIAAAFGFPGFANIKVKPRRDVCTACGTKIPPGKPGRKCKECRKSEKEHAT